MLSPREFLVGNEYVGNTSGLLHLTAFIDISVVFVLMVGTRTTIVLLFTLACMSIFLTTFILKNAKYNAVVHHNLVISAGVQAEALKYTQPESINEECPNGILMYGEYCVTSPYSNETRNTSDASVITLCTQSTVEYLQHVVVLCHRWSNPISVAVYSPEGDYEDAQILVHLLRKCNACVRYWVKWHFFYPKQFQVPIIDEYQLSGSCNDITSVKKPKKRRSQGTYPINVGRNLARQLSNTPFVFSIDIELYPSLNIPSKFERMIESQSVKTQNQVWVIPIFEIFSKYRAPLLKSELRNMYKKKVAISFHQYRCNICHKIPNLTQWIEHQDENSSEIEDTLEPLRIWSTVKRSRKFKLQYWEPFFIGTKKDPEFDIRLSWEGKENKMQVAYEMCMRDYDFHIIENAFLVHSPGINVYNATKDKDRLKHSLENHRLIIENKKKLKEKYGSKPDC